MRPRQLVTPRARARAWDDIADVAACGRTGALNPTDVTFIDAGRLMFKNDKLDKARIEINTTLAGPLARAA